MVTIAAVGATISPKILFKDLKISILVVTITSGFIPSSMNFKYAWLSVATLSKTL